MPSAPLTTSDLIFPTQSLNLSSTLNSLKRSALSIHNRLVSITQDSGFVCSVADAYGLPLVANERCGNWYIPLERKAGSAYFKSTDGHMNEWSFSMRRLNLHFLDVVAKDYGAVVVDSTRRGKSMPDALSKTVPIWCCVLNRAIFPELGPHSLHTPPQAVSPSEHSQIERRIDGFVQQFKDTNTSPLDELKQRLQKPLRPLWVTQESSLPTEPPNFPDFHPIVLCTASRCVHGGEISEGGYIQGAADDQEAWSRGLTPELFWKNKETLLTTNEEDLPSIIESLIAEDPGAKFVPVLIKPTTTLYVSSTKHVDAHDFDVVISCGETTSKSFLTADQKKHMHLTCRNGKLGSRDLRAQLPELSKFMSALPSPPGKILICCASGKDLSLGVAITILCLYTSPTGEISNIPTATPISKSFIRQRLTWLTNSNPAFNPSRETLKSVNAFLMPDPSQSFSPLSGPVSGAAQPVDSSNSSSQTPPPPTPGRKSLVAQIFDSLCTYPSSTSPSSPSPTPKPWKFTRRLTSALPTHPSGTVTGTASFTPCPTGSPDYSGAYLYSEEGEFVADTGLKFQARRRYVYRINGGKGKVDGEGEEGKEEDKNVEEISISFFDDERAAKPTDQSSQSDGHLISPRGDGIGSFFVALGALSYESTWSGVMTAKNKESHLCIDDLYAASWRFGPGMFEKGGDDAETGGNGRWWEVRYDVKGPMKEYVSLTRYE